MSDPLAEFYRVPTDDEPLTQGDILAAVSCIDARSPGGELKTVLVMSHSCEIDKASAATCYAAVVRLFTPKELKRPGFLEPIRTGLSAAAFYLPSSELLGGEGFADLRSMYRIPYTAIGATTMVPDENGKDQHRVLDGTTKRMVALSDAARLALGTSIGRFFFRPDLASAE